MLTARAVIAAAVVLGIAAASVLAVSLMVKPANEGSDEAGIQERLPNLGVGRVWPGTHAPGVDRSGPVETAESFARDIVGNVIASSVPDPFAPANGPTWVTVTLTNGSSVRALCVPGTDGGWVVLQVGEGNLVYTAGTSELRFGEPAEAAAGAEVAWRDAGGVHAMQVSRDSIATRRIPLHVAGALQSAVVVPRDRAHRAVGILGGYFEQ